MRGGKGREREREEDRDRQTGHVLECFDIITHIIPVLRVPFSDHTFLHLYFHRHRNKQNPARNGCTEQRPYLIRSLMIDQINQLSEFTLPRLK